MLPLAGMIIAGLTSIVFLADLTAGFPFQRVNVALDVGFLVAGTIVAYLSWSLLDRS